MPPTPDPIIAILFVVAGLVLGSFSNVLIPRLPAGKSIKGRSKCPYCEKVLHPVELIPLAGFVLLLGRCSGCRARIALRYPLVEAANGVLALAALRVAPTLLTGALLAIALWLLFTIAVIDARTQGIPDALNLPFVLLSFLYGATAAALDWRAPALGAGFFALQWTFSRGRWVGSGDVLLALGTSALLATVPRVLLTIGLTYIIGASVALVLLATKRATRKTRLAFAPFLAAGTILALVFGNWILDSFVLP